jgi:carboxypeptidase Taq
MRVRGLTLFKNPLIKEIIEKYKVIWAIDHALSVMGWDSETYMPRGGVKERATARAILSVLRRRFLLDPELVSLVEKAKKEEDLNDYERGVIRVMDRAININKKLPQELIYEFSKTSQEAMKVWEEAKRADDYKKFEPYLEKLVSLSREMAEKLGYEKHPYDALLDLYEEGLRVDDMDFIFNSLIPRLKKTLDKVISGGYFPSRHPLEDVRYEREALEKVDKEILDVLGFPWERARIDVSEHPFTIGISVNDVRITTRFEGIDFKRNIYAVIHEFGHALYELQIDPELSGTPIGSAVSSGIHESQSRFWENIVGRSLEFIKIIKPILDKHLKFTQKFSEEEIFKYVNTVRPSLIRVDADEVTYNFHIYLRYEIEKKLIAGEMNVKEVPEFWNELMEKLLGVRPKTYREGVLQDIHWSMGSFGYFPTYTLGNVVSAQVKQALERRLGTSLRNLIIEGRLNDIKEGLRELIHRWGSTFSPKELLERSIGEKYNPEPFLNYIENKYLKV